MELTVVIEPLPDGHGFSAHAGSFPTLSATGATFDEAYDRLAGMIHERIQTGMQIRSLSIPAGARLPEGGWLPDDDLTTEWLELVRQYRAECDAADRERLEQNSDAEEAST